MLSTLVEKILLLTVTVCICSQARDQASSSSTIFEKEWIFDKNSLFSYDRSLSKVPNTFVYAFCNTSTFVKVNDCTFVLNNLQPQDSRSPQKACRTKLTGTDDGNFNFIFERFENNDILIVRLEVINDEVLSKYSLLDLKTCNLVNSQEKYEEADYMQTVIYRNSFDIITRPKNKSCGSNLCRVTRNNEVVPFPGYLNTELILPVNPDGPQDGFFAVGHHFDSYVMDHVTPDGQTTNLMTHPLDYVNRCYFTPRPNGKFGVCCNVSPDQMRCSQFSKAGDSWRSFHVDLDRRKVLTLHNPSNGGLLVLSSDCDDKMDLSYCDNTTATMIYEGGRKEVLFTILEPVFTCETYDALVSVEIHEVQGVICVDFAFICTIHTNDGFKTVLKLNRKCENDDLVNDDPRVLDLPVPEFEMGEQLPA